MTELTLEQTKEAANVRRLIDAVLELNDTLSEAAEQGLTVELKVLDITTMEDKTPKAYVDGRAFREVVACSDLMNVPELPGGVNCIEPEEPEIDMVEGI